MERMIKSGLYEAADKIYVTVNLAEESRENFESFMKDYRVSTIEYTEQNTAEYLGIKKVKEAADSFDNARILYLHTKGVSNQYSDSVSKEISTLKIHNIQAWKEFLEYYVIDKWRETVEKLDEYDTAGASCVSGWYWGNFWWAKSEHLRKCREVDIWGRWDYEAWLNSYVEGPKNFQWYNFSFNPYLSEVYPEWYKEQDKFKGSKIYLKKAMYGTPPFQIDEGYSSSNFDILTDVTDVVQRELEKENNEKMHFPVTNEFLGADPIFGEKKFLFLEFFLDTAPDKTYKVAFSEYRAADLNFN
jgi:hypothetical protein